jgi:glucosamine kinase
MSKFQDSILIGVDGGGTGCRIIIADGNLTVLARASGARANVATDFVQAIRNIQEAITKAAQSAGITEDALSNAQVHLGLAGVLCSADAQKVAAALPYALINVTDDRPTAVEGALGDKNGFLISVGTGTIIATRQGRKNSYVGGWGFYVADQASGAWLGKRLLEETLLCYDEIKPHSP